jgi:hypothetical protein
VQQFLNVLGPHWHTKENGDEEHQAEKDHAQLPHEPHKVLLFV